jgi:hypothetical protein
MPFSCMDMPLINESPAAVAATGSYVVMKFSTTVFSELSDNSELASMNRPLTRLKRANC